MTKFFIFMFFTFITFNVFSLNIQDIKIVTEELPPFLFLDKNGDAQGLLANRVNEVIKKLKIKNKIEVQPWVRAYVTALKNEGTMLFPMAKTKDRELLFKYCCVIFKARIYLFKLKSRTDIHLKTIAEAKKYTVGVVREDIKHKILTNLGFPHLEIAASQEINFKKFIGKRTDLFASNETSLQYQLKEINMSLQDVVKLVEITNTDPNRYIAFNNNTDDAIIAQVKNTLKDIYNPENE